MSEEKSLSLNEKLDLVLEKLTEEEEVNKKKFRLPWMMRLFGRIQIKKGYVVVFFIRTNGALSIKMVKIDGDTVKLGDYFYDARANSILRYKKFPVLILFEWNMLPLKPLNLEENFEQASDDGTLTAAEGLILTRMKSDAIKPKMNINMGVILIIGACLVGGYFLLKYMKLI